MFVGVIRRRPAALAEIFERYGGQVHAEATRWASREDAEKVLHRVFDELWHAPHLYDGAPGDLLAPLLDRTRAWARAGGPERDQRPGRSHGPTSNPSAMLTRLAPHESEAIVLARRPGFTYREVAAVLGRAESTVRRDIRHGLIHLHQQMITAFGDDT